MAILDDVSWRSNCGPVLLAVPAEEVVTKTTVKTKATDRPGAKSKPARRGAGTASPSKGKSTTAPTTKTTRLFSLAGTQRVG